jgi:hypothetical protein
MTNVNYILKTDHPITFPATAFENIGYDSTGKVWPEPPDTTVGLLLQFTGDNQVGLMSTSSGAYFAGVNEVPAYAGENITVRTCGIVLLTVGGTDVVAGNFVKQGGTAQTVIPMAGADDPNLVIGQAMTGGTAGGKVKVILRGF